MTAEFRNLIRGTVVSLAFATCSMPFAQQQPEPPTMPPMYIISDLHFSVGRAGGKDFHPMEDFRWNKAFNGFLRYIAADNPTGIQLVIAGDFLELWQHPTVPCAKLKDTECGCTLDEMQRIVKDVLAAHRDEFISIGEFLANPNNSVVVLPGNHDAALTHDMIWSTVRDAVPQGRERFTRVDDGILLTADGRIGIEHGHQQAFDVNSFPDWPRGVVKLCGAEQRFFRTWGENFVQSLYNEVETQVPLIDNMVPDAEGRALYERYSEQRGTKWGDIARFIEFNLLQTSFYQKIQGLSLDKPNEQLTREQVQKCRLCLGEETFLIGNPLTDEILKRGGDDAKSLREALRERESKLGDNEAKMLCERAVLLNAGKLSLNRGRVSNPVCDDPLATGVRAIFDSDGSLTLRARVGELYEKSKGRLAFYVFGHTHEARLNMPVEMPDGLTIGALNTGAFQRLMSRPFFDSKRKQNESELDALKRLGHEDLAACYSTVKITYKGRRPDAELREWFMQESDSQGKLLDGCDVTCSAPPGNCGKKKGR